MLNNLNNKNTDKIFLIDFVNSNNYNQCQVWKIKIIYILKSDK